MEKEREELINAVSFENMLIRSSYACSMYNTYLAELQEDADRGLEIVDNLYGKLVATVLSNFMYNIAKLHFSDAREGKFNNKVILPFDITKECENYEEQLETLSKVYHINYTMVNISIDNWIYVFTVDINYLLSKVNEIFVDNSEE